jgi:hypothetical protein
MRRNGKIQNLEKPSLPSCLTELQSEVLLGSLLGDGCLFRYKTTHKAYYAVQRCRHDKDYAEWQKNVFDPFVCRFYDGCSFDVRTGKTYEWSKFITRRTGLFDELYDLWYGTGLKKVPDTSSLSPLALAIWFADDGYARSMGSPWRLQLKLSTHGFPLDSVEFLCNLLQVRYGEYFGITLEGEAKHPIIYASDSAARCFFKEIDQHLPASISRKAIWRQEQVRFYKDIPERGCASHVRKSKNGIRYETHQIPTHDESSLVGV